MRFIYTLLLLGSLTSVTTTAQTLGLGLRGGLAIADIRTDAEDSNISSITGYAAGVVMPIKLSPTFYLQPELSFVRKGYQEELRTFGALFDIELRTDYVELPLLLQARFGNERVKAYLQGGPVYGFAISGNATVEQGSQLSEEVAIDWDDRDYENYNRSDFSLQFGAGLLFPLGTLSVPVDFRYGLALSDFDGNAGIINNNRGFALTTGIIFPLAK